VRDQHGGFSVDPNQKPLVAGAFPSSGSTRTTRPPASTSTFERRDRNASATDVPASELVLELDAGGGRSTDPGGPGNAGEEAGAVPGSGERAT
jgi:hypothetical protein